MNTSKIQERPFQFSLRTLLVVVMAWCVVWSGFCVSLGYVLIGAVLASFTVFFASCPAAGINKDQRALVATAFGVGFLMWLLPPWVPSVQHLSWSPTPTYSLIFWPIDGANVSLDYLALQWLGVGLTMLILLPFFRSKKRIYPRE